MERNYIDLFAGAGGLSEGFYRQGFKPVAHVEMDYFATLTLKTRIAKQYLFNKNREDIYYSYLQEKISREKLYSYIPQKKLNAVINKEITENSIEEISLEIKHKKIDLIIGGPPCQAYSLVGRARDPQRKKLDKKNYLYKHYIEFLKIFKPKVFVFENVPGLLSAGNKEYYNDMKKKMSEAGYITEDKILNSADYGVLQKRKRVIFVGWRKDISFSYPEFDIFKSNFTISDLFYDLPALLPGETNNSYTGKSNKCLNNMTIRNGHGVLTQNSVRITNNHDRKIYKLVIEKWNSEKKRLLYTEIPKRLRTHHNTSSFLDRFKVVDGQGLSHTMVAHIAKDGHYYIHPDAKQLRSLSVREAARIQSFPDDYFFEGPRTSVLTQIGNAVPVLMAEKLAEKIKEML